MRWSRLFALAAASALTPVGLAACDSHSGSQQSGGPIAVQAADSACTLAVSETRAGTVTFKVTNKGAKVTEFYVYGPGDRIMGEVENVAPGLARELHVELPAGSYQTSCRPGMTGKGIRAAFTVTGSAGPLTDNAKVHNATESYQRYIESQTAALLTKTQEFVNAVKAGDVVKAKALFPVARTYWERIEPVAEIFGDLDPKIDGRAEVIAEGRPWTGFHRIEKDLWTTGNITKDGPLADNLMTDVREIVQKANTTKLSALNLADGAKELLDEVATGKITGEEDRYSHTDLWDFAANIEGSKAAIASLRPILEQRDPALVSTLDARFAAVDTELGKHRVGDGWRFTNQLSQAELKKLSDVINGLAEPISEVAGVVAKK